MPWVDGAPNLCRTSLCVVQSPYFRTYMFHLLMRVNRLCWLLLLFSYPCFAQTTTVATLQKQLKQPMPDTTRLRLLADLCSAYTSVDPIKKMDCARQCKALAEKLHNDKAIADAYLDMGISCGIRGLLDSSIYYFNAGYAQAQKVGYLKGMGRNLMDIGFAYDRMDRQNESVKYYFRALPIFKKLKLQKNINQTLINIGAIYYDLNQFKIAETYFTEVYNNNKAANDTAGIAYGMSALANCYMETGRYAQATDFYRKSLAIYKKLGDKNRMALIYEQRSVMNRYQHNYSQALSGLDTALDLARQLQDKYEQATMLGNVSETYLAMKDYADCIKSGEAGLKIERDIKFMHGISEMLIRLSKAYAGSGNIKKAYETQSAYVKLQDSLINQKTLQDITLIEFSRVRDENLDLTKNNQLMASQNTSKQARIDLYGVVIGTITIVTVLLFLLLLVQYRRNLEKQEANKLLIEQKEEIAGINNQLEMANEEVTSQMELVSKQKDELEKLNNIKNLLFSIISHDLRGPLSSLQTLFSIYREGDLSQEELSALLAQLEDNILSTRAFLDNLLEWSKGQLEGIAEHPVEFNLSDCIDENIRLWDSKISIKGLSVTNDSGEAPAMAFADRDMINLVIRNLLSNAVKFCRPGDEIRLKAEQNGDKALFSIADTGPGISAKDRERLFKLDHTVSTGSHGEHGTHLGLILCQDMVTRNKGRLWLETEEGKGTTFWMELPLGMPGQKS